MEKNYGSDQSRRTLRKLRDNIYVTQTQIANSVFQVFNALSIPLNYRHGDIIKLLSQEIIEILTLIAKTKNSFKNNYMGVLSK